MRSARYAGANASDGENLAKLRREVAARQPARVRVRDRPRRSRRRGALFYGRCAGTMAAEGAGTRGFGYDPVFVPDGERRTMAELGDEEKDAISHRGLAARALLEWLGA